MTIFVDIYKTDTSIFSLEDIAVLRASSITDDFLELDNYYDLWNEVVVDFGDIGKVTRSKDDIVAGEFGDYFKKGFGLCKSCIGTCILGPIGFFCGLCGMGKTKGKFKDKRTYSNKITYCCLDCGEQFE